MGVLKRPQKILIDPWCISRNNNQVSRIARKCPKDLGGGIACPGTRVDVFSLSIYLKGIGEVFP